MRESVLAQARHTQIALLANITDFKVRSTESERFQRAKSKSVFDGLLEDSSLKLRMTVGALPICRAVCRFCGSLREGAPDGVG